MYTAIPLCNMQRKRRFTVAEGGMLVSIKNSVNPIQDEPFFGLLLGEGTESPTP